MRSSSSTSAARKLTADHVGPAEPANDAAPEPPADATAPRASLSESDRATLRNAAFAVAASTLTGTPTHIHDRVTWLDGVFAQAWRDRASITRVPVKGQTLSVDELREFGRSVEYLRELALDHEVPEPVEAAPPADALPSPATMSTPEIKAELRTRGASLCNALQLEYEDDPPVRAMVSQVRATRSAREVTVNYGLLRRVLRKEGMAAWLRSLPLDETATYERLCALHDEWVKRSGDKLTAPVDERMVERAYRVADRTAQRILRVGRYLVKGDPARKGDYAAFKAPTPARAAKVAPSPAPAPPQPPTP